MEITISGKFRKFSHFSPSDPRNPADPTRSDFPFPATHRRRHRPRPTRLRQAILLLVSPDPGEASSSSIGEARFAANPTRRPAEIPATSDHTTGQFLLLSSRSIDPWWWIIKSRLVEIGTNSRSFGSTMGQRLFRPLPVRISLSGSYEHCWA